MTDAGCICGRPTRDDAYLCDECVGDLAKVLGNVPWLAEQLHLTATRQTSKGDGGRGTETPLPFHDKASDVLAALRNELTTTVRTCVEDRVRHSSPGPEWPADTMESMSHWLLWRVDGLAFHETGPDVLRHLGAIEGRTLRVINNRPPRTYLGVCKAEVDGDECGGPVYARAGEPTGRCDRADCRAEYDTAASRATLEAALDDRLCTAAEIARLSTYLGLSAPRESVRKRVNQWHSRDRIEAKGADDKGDPMFRYGEVRGLLYSEFTSVDTRAS